MARETITRGRPALSERLRSPASISRLRPTGRGVSVALVAIVLLTVVLVTGDSTLWLVVVVVALPLAIAPVVVLARARRAAGIQVHLVVTPPLVPVGGLCTLLVQLSRAGGRDLPPLSLDRPSDHWSARASVAPRSTRRPRRSVALENGIGRLIRCGQMGSDTGASLAIELPTRRRGVFTVGPLRLWVHDPFGLCAVTVAVAKPVTLVVHPPAVAGSALETVRPGALGSTQFGDGPAAVHTDDPGGEWNGLRPYVPGDRLHLLSWQAEARLGALLVHDFRPDSEVTVTIVLDDRAGVHRRPTFEKALGAVYGLVLDAEGLGHDYDVSTFSGRRARGSTTPDGLVALWTFLAETQPVRSRDHGGTSAFEVPTDALVVTTPTAVPSLPSWIDQSSVVVAE